MTTYGVTHLDLAGSDDDFKRSILYFERLFFDRSFLEDFLEITALKFLSGHGRSESIGELMATVDYLYEKGILVDVNLRGLLARVSADSEFAIIRDDVYRQIDDINRDLNRYNGIVTGEEPGFGRGMDIDYALALNGAVDSKSRSLARHLARITPTLLAAAGDIREPIPLLFDDIAVSQQSRKAQIVNIVIHHFPVPAPLTGLEEILEFRNDPSSLSHFLAIRNWVTDVAQSKLTISEIAEKLEFLLHQYTTHMARHKLKTQRSTVEVVVTATAETLENIVKLNWSRALQKLFDLRRGELQLLEAEAAAPGREVAYVQKIAASGLL